MSDPDDVHVLLAPGRHTEAVPADVLSTICNVIALAYPHATMGAGDAALRGWTVTVPAADREPRTKVGKRAAARAFVANDTPNMAGWLGFDGQDMSMIPPEALTRGMAELAATVLAAVDGASNYVEQSATHPELGSFVAIFARSKAQTPHALRQAAEARADAAEAALADAWDKGYTSGHSNAMRRMSDEPDAPSAPNPYRTEGDTP